jgi:Ca-activated chloride channel family protein
LITLGTANGKSIETTARVTKRTLIPTVLGILLATTLYGAPASGAAEAQEQVTFRGGVDLVTATISVRDRRGRVITDLKQADFEIIDDGAPRPIQTFESGESPVSIAILVDISGSMAVGGNIQRARTAVTVAMAALRNGSDEAALFTFDSKLQEIVSFTSDLARLRRVRLEGKPWGQTSLFDAVAETARLVADRPHRHRAVFVITDGVDTGSRLKAPEVSAIASSINVPVYLLTVVNPLDHPGGDFSVLTETKAAESATLADLARWTGGDMRIASMPEHTASAIVDLFFELRHQYLISFEPGEREGWHPLEIRARKNDLIVRARSGYMAGRPRPS